MDKILSHKAIFNNSSELPILGENDQKLTSPGTILPNSTTVIFSEYREFCWFWEQTRWSFQTDYSVLRYLLRYSHYHKWKFVRDRLTTVFLFLTFRPIHNHNDKSDESDLMITRIQLILDHDVTSTKYYVMIYDVFATWIVIIFSTWFRENVIIFST